MNRRGNKNREWRVESGTVKWLAVFLGFSHSTHWIFPIHSRPEEEGSKVRRGAKTEEDEKDEVCNLLDMRREVMESEDSLLARTDRLMRRLWNQKTHSRLGPAGSNAGYEIRRLTLCAHRRVSDDKDSLRAVEVAEYLS